MKRFMEIVREAKAKRQELEEKLGLAAKEFAIAGSSSMEKELEGFFAWPNCQIKVESTSENVMSVWIPKFKHQIEGDFKSYSALSSPLGMTGALEKFWHALEVMIALAGIEHSARLLSFEIEKTRRRVNALEYVIVPQMAKSLKLIAGKLDEQERAEKIVRMKIKDMLTA